jgi:signal transduction histidine kinase
LHELTAKATRHANALRAKGIRSLLDTQRAELDLALARNRVENLEASTEARKTMVSRIARELRNPITTVLGLSSEVYRTWADLSGDEARELIAMICDEAEDLANIVEDLLAAARIERGGLKVAPVMCDLDPIVETVLSRSAPEGKSLTSVGEAAAFVDPSRFRQIMRNLMTNAIRYCGDRITVLVGSEGRVTTVEIRDSGGGIPFSDREVIFEPFERGEGVGHGTRSIGLGLAVTRDLARLMDGNITYSHDGTESVFRLSLPACG